MRARTGRVTSALEPRVPSLSRVGGRVVAFRRRRLDWCGDCSGEDVVANHRKGQADHTGGVGEAAAASRTSEVHGSQVASRHAGQIVTLASDIIRTKALDLLVEHADIQTEDPPTDTSGEQAAEAASQPEPEEP